MAAAAETYSHVLGMPVPQVQRGAVIKADMAVFDLGPTGLTVAQPAEPGPAAEALARRGPGPFQVLYRTRSMDVAARWMADHGVLRRHAWVSATPANRRCSCDRTSVWCLHRLRGTGVAPLLRTASVRTSPQRSRATPPATDAS